MSRKKFLLLGLTVAAVAAFVAPASASALMLYYEGHSIEKPITFEMAGTLNWTTSTGNGVDCKMKTIVDAETNDAKITNVIVDTSSCRGTGFYEGCTVIKDTVTGLPWTVDLYSAGWRVTDQTIDYELACLLTTTTSISVAEVTAPVDNPKAIKAISLSGTGTSGLESATISGEFEILGGAAGKLSIAE